MAEIRLKRIDGVRADHYRAYRVFIDNQRVGQIRVGQEKSFEVPPGEHELQLRIDWTTSEKLGMDLSDGERADFVCGPGATPWNVLKMITWGRRRYIDLRRDE